MRKTITAMALFALTSAPAAAESYPLQTDTQTKRTICSELAIVAKLSMTSRQDSISLEDSIDRGANSLSITPSIQHSLMVRMAITAHEQPVWLTQRGRDQAIDRFEAVVKRECMTELSGPEA